ncbi:MAG TPA: hypothetical protein VN668_20985 [Stellaceae bacterium]|nr:hypothetical protein [Stellaceae bacterium]
MAPPRVPPTRFGPSAAQPGGRAVARRVPPAPPPTRFGPSTALLRKLAGSPFSRGAGVIQRMESGLLSTGNKTETAKKPCASCTMGQGLTGQLDEVVLHSSGFSSCGPIIMFNSASLRGGLFHFAAGNLEAQAAPLLQMFNEVKPTELHIPKRDELTPGTWDGMMARDAHREESDQPPDDGEVLEEFFKQRFKKAMKTAPRGESYYVTANASGSLVISPGMSPEPMCDTVDYSNTKYPKIPPDAMIGIATVALFGRNMYRS